MDLSDPKVEWATFGKLVEDFLTSDIGDYLIRCAKDKERLAVEKLKVVAPWRRKRIQELQNEIEVAEEIQRWLGNAVAAGQAAMEQLKEEHNG